MGESESVNLRDMTYDQLDQLAAELRASIVETVGRNGGHLASNLGVVELTIALHRVYDTPRDKLIFDVGHQCYAHKLLTGRADRFSTIRAQGGLSGYPSRGESPHDAFGTGHASTGVSAALGFARARDILGEASDIAVVLGDGALTGGETYEALNDAGHTVQAGRNRRADYGRHAGGGALVRGSPIRRTGHGTHRAQRNKRSPGQRSGKRAGMEGSL